MILYFHGGYWVSGDLNSEDLGCRAIIAHGNAVLLTSFSYRFAPENALKWTAAHTADFGGDVPKGFTAGGAMSGAQLAAICAIRVRNYLRGVRLTGQILIVPTVLSWQGPEDIPAEWAARINSLGGNGSAPVLDEASWQRFLNLLAVPDSEKRRGENFLVWGSLEGLPLAYLAINGLDPIRDEGRLYEELLRKADVQTRTDFYAGLPNMFV